MKPCLANRRVVEVLAGLSWEASLSHRIYSCPDGPEFDFVFGATALILFNRRNGARVPLEVCSVARIAAGELENLSGMAQPLRIRLAQYLAEIGTNEQIIHPGCAHRFYFLSDEPWPVRMQEATAAATATEWTAVLSICSDPDHFFRWPSVGELLWPGCIRTRQDGEYRYPDELLGRLAELGIPPDTRTNGPAIVSFLAAGGIRPNWGNEGWPIHHIFDGTQGTPHAVRDGGLFTHSAGLVAAHPVAHHLAHQSIVLRWLLRREAFLRFCFDPAGDFSPG
jgi:hypothetical protein